MYKSFLKRVSDISIGDYSEKKGNELIDVRKGASTVLVNSDKGAKLIENIKDKILIEI